MTEGVERTIDRSLGAFIRTGLERKSKGYLPNGFREGHGEASSGVVVTKQCLGYGLSSEFTRKPGMDDGRNMGSGEVDG